MKVPDSEARDLCLGEGKVNMSVGTKVATMPSGKPLSRTDSLEITLKVARTSLKMYKVGRVRSLSSRNAQQELDKGTEIISSSYRDYLMCF